MSDESETTKPVNGEEVPAEEVHDENLAADDAKVKDRSVSDVNLKETLDAGSPAKPSKRRSSTITDAFKFMHGFTSRLFHGKQNQDEIGKIFRTCEMHTGGEPLRIIEGGYPDIPGNTIQEKRSYVMDNLDNYRKILLWEPRGHRDMYGALLVKPCRPDAHLGVIFMTNEGYSTMCGHAIIALSRYAVDKGIISRHGKDAKEAEVHIETPAGLIKAYVDITTVDPVLHGTVRFINVPAFVAETDITLKVEGIGPVKVDVSYGGTFYALAEGRDLGINIKSTSIMDAIKSANAITKSVKSQVSLKHPDNKDVEFLYGTIITDSFKAGAKEATNICVFADSEVDRSPTGTGVTARLAAMYAKKLVQVGDVITFANGITGSKFEGKIVEETTCGDNTAVIVEVKGKAHYCGSSVFTFEESDDLAYGFLPKFL